MTVRRWLSVLAILAMAIGLVAACGGDDDDEGSGTQAQTTATGPDIEHAQSQIDAFRAEPQFEAPGPDVDAAAAEGMSLAIIPASSNVPFVTTIANNMVRIGREIGLDVTVFRNNGSPAEWTQGVTDAIAQDADSIDLLAGLDPAAISAQVRQATNQDISVVATHLYDVNQEPDPNVTATMDIPYEQAGRLLADWVITQTDGKANVLVTTINQVNSTVPMVAGIEDEFATYCGDGCKVTKIDSTLAELSRLQGQVQSALTRDPGINYVINLYDSAQAPQTEAAIKALDRKDLKIATFNGTPEIMEQIGPNSVIAMDIAENLDWIAHGAIDQHLRLMTGAEPSEDPHIPLRVFDASNIAEATGSGLGFGDAYADAYRELWGIQ